MILVVVYLAIQAIEFDRWPPRTVFWRKTIHLGGSRRQQRQHGGCKSWHCSSPLCPLLSEVSQVFPYFSFSSPGLASSRRAEDWLLSPSISLPGPSPPSCFCLPSPRHWLQPPSCPSSAAGTRTRRHRDFSLPWARQETVPNTSKHSAVMN